MKDAVMADQERYENIMKNNRLIFYKEDIEKIESVLDKFIEKSQANCVLLVDLEGHLVAKKGFTSDLDTTSISALVAGAFASTQAVAKKLGEKEFSVMFHQGENENIHISLVGTRSLAVIIFDDRTTIGMVRLYATQVAEELGKIFSIIEDKQNSGERQGLSKNYTEQAEAQLDSFFEEDK
jgi:predicted regulator of Ras-like GTPase activity (Roadblock/LC7/MglB family)